MAKTIKEAAREAVRKEYLCDKCAWKDNCDFCGGENTAFDCCECLADSYEDGFKACANYVYGLPLRERLTAEEKDRVKEIYNGEREHVQFQMEQANASMNQICRSWHNQLKDGSYAKLRLLESIFGKDFFKED